MWTPVIPRLRFARKSDLLLLKWMIGFNLAFTATIPWRVIDLV